jgi:hypothetical protein
MREYSALHGIRISAWVEFKVTESLLLLWVIKLGGS